MWITTREVRVEEQGMIAVAEVCPAGAAWYVFDGDQMVDRGVRNSMADARAAAEHCVSEQAKRKGL